MHRLLKVLIVVVFVAGSGYCEYSIVNKNFFANDLNDAIWRAQSKLHYYHEQIEPNVCTIIQFYELLLSEKFNLYEIIFHGDFKQSREKVSQICLDKIEYLLKSLKKKDLWAISGKMKIGCLFFFLI